MLLRCLLLTGFTSFSQCCVLVCGLFFFKKKEVQATKGHGGLLALALTHVKAGDFCLRMAIRHLSKEELRALNCKKGKTGRVAVIKKQ